MRVLGYAILCLGLLLSCTGERLRGQQPKTFSAEVKVVNVLATVRDKKGAIVSDLNKEDFALEEDGRPQPIRYFARETDLPLTLGLVVDTSGSQRRVLGQERSASYRFLEQVLREDKDQAFLIHFDVDVELLQDLTPSRRKLEAALNLLEGPPMQRANRGNWPGPAPGGGGGAAAVGRGACLRRIPTERRFSKDFPRRPAAPCSRFPKSTPSRRSTAAFKRNCATSTASATRPIAPILPWDIVESI